MTNRARTQAPMTGAGPSPREATNRRFVWALGGATIALFAGMLLFMELGRHLGLRDVARYGADARVGVGVVDEAIYGLFALLIGFTFAGAALRFDNRRDLVGQEVNAIGTAWQRIDLLPAERQESIRTAFRRYVDVLIGMYVRPTGVQASMRESPASARAQEELWLGAVAACVDPSGEKARMLLLPVLNDVFGLVEKERQARRLHPPFVIYGMLVLTALTSAMFAGYGLAVLVPHRNLLYTVGLATATAIAVYVIVDLEFPRLGLIRVDAFDRLLVDLRATMESPEKPGAVGERGSVAA
jgi:hypothetical protein